MTLDHKTSDYMATCLCEALREQGLADVDAAKMQAIIDQFIDGDAAAEAAFWWGMTCA